MKLRKVLLWSLLASIIAIPVMIVIQNIFGGFWILGLRRVDFVYGLLASAALHLIPAQICGMAYERRKLQRLMIAALVAGAISLLSWWTLVVRYMMNEEPSLWQFGPSYVYAVLTLAGLLSLHASRHPINEIGRVVAMLAFAAAGACVLALAVVYKHAHLSGDVQETLGDYSRRGTAVTGVIGLAALIVVVVQYRLSRQDDETGPILPFEGTCPRCGRALSLSTGGDSCAACKLRITLKVVS